MSTFEQSRSLRNQRHFEVLEIDLPVITGACTINGAGGFGTPLYCDEAWSGEYQTYSFTNVDAPLLPGSPWRLIKSTSESPTIIKSGDGLASRATLKFTLIDTDGQDPNPNAPGVTSIVKKQGTLLGKLAARQIFDNKVIRHKLYREEADGTVDLVNGAQTRHWIADTFTYKGNNEWELSCKDSLSIANLNDKVWPIQENSILRQDIDDTTLVIPVDATTDYSNAFAVRIGDEHFLVASVTDNQGAAAALNVVARGASIFAPISGELLTETVASSHSAGDEVFICSLSDNETIDSLLARVLTDSELDAALIPSADWAAEVTEWHAATRINTLHSESVSVNEKLANILTGYLMDMWFSPEDNEVKLSAISVWRNSSGTIREGAEIIAHSVKRKALPNLRASRALVKFDKRNIADDDSTASYKKAAEHHDNAVVSPALYAKHKDKLFEPNNLIDTESAKLLVQRYVGRYKFMPFSHPVQSDERYATHKTGAVIDVETASTLTADGASSAKFRAQIVSSKINYTKFGRVYNLDLLTYEQALQSNTERLLDGILDGVNLYTESGNPPDAVELTFILSNRSRGASIVAGNFPAGSKIILIMIDGFNGQARGGKGGNNNNNGEDGGVVYDAMGVDTDIYFSGVTPSAEYPIADGRIRAPGGGGAGGNDHHILPPVDILNAGGGGGGGAGFYAGNGGISTGGIGGFDGTDGDDSGNGGVGGSGAGSDGVNGGDWGQAGQNSLATPSNPVRFGGAAGSGIIDNGATVVLYGSNSGRYINGNGDH